MKTQMKLLLQKIFNFAIFYVLTRAQGFIYAVVAVIGLEIDKSHNSEHFFIIGGLIILTNYVLSYLFGLAVFEVLILPLWLTVIIYSLILNKSELNYVFFNQSHSSVRLFATLIKIAGDSILFYLGIKYAPILKKKLSEANLGFFSSAIGRIAVIVTIVGIWLLGLLISKVID